MVDYLRKVEMAVILMCIMVIVIITCMFPNEIKNVFLQHKDILFKIVIIVVVSIMATVVLKLFSKVIGIK